MKTEINELKLILKDTVFFYKRFIILEKCNIRSGSYSSNGILWSANFNNISCIDNISKYFGNKITNLMNPAVNSSGKAQYKNPMKIPASRNISIFQTKNTPLDITISLTFFFNKFHFIQNMSSLFRYC